MALTWPLAHAQPQAADATPVIAGAIAPGAAADESIDTNATTRLSAEVSARYPANTIDSVARATAALDDVARARLRVEAQLARDERACTSVFFTTRCLDQAREHRRAALAGLRPVEIEANTYKRRARVDERERAQAQKTTKPEPAMQPREAKPAQPGLPADAPAADAGRSAAGPAVAPGAGSAGPSDKTSAASDSRALAAGRAASRSAPRQAAAVTPAMRRATEEANMAAFDRKAAESANRQREIAAKKAEKEQDRLRKNAAAAPPLATPPSK